MITGYDIKNIDGENILFLYLNYDSEFGIDFRLDHKLSNMKREINKFMKQNKIKLNGEKVALSFGGVVLAVLLMIPNETISDDFDFTYVSQHIIPNEIVEVIDKEENIVDNNQEIIEDVPSVENNEENISNSNSNINNTVNVPNKNDNINSNNNMNTQDKNDNQNDSGTINKPVENEKVEEDKVTEKQVTVYRSNGTVITLSLEEYLIGVVGAEMPASFPIEALKAQAVVSRTYALKKIESGGKLTDTVSTQSYKDNSELQKMWGSSYNTYYQKVKTAVESTNGLAIYYQGNLIDAVYHSTSNGRTQDSVLVWGNDIPYLKSVDSSWDKNASSYFREVSQDFNNVLRILGLDINGDISFEILSRDSSGRVLEVRVGNKTFSGVDFRNLLGLRSADFDLVLKDNNLIITTRGFGHGVGLSQYGASGMAKSGYNYEQILKHYYTGVLVY